MSDVADRYRKLASTFTERVRAVPDDAWGNQSPCTDWKARDVVDHVAGTSAWFLGRAGVDAPQLPPVDEDPVGAWETARDAVQAALDDPAVAGREVESPMGAMPFEQLVSAIGCADLLIHTWDLARAAGLDESLDLEEVERALAAMEPNDERLRGPAFGPKVEVGNDADVQTRLIAFSGRTP